MDPKENGNRPASPTMRGAPKGENGLTKREAFAAQILAGIIAADRDVDPTVVARVYPQAAVRYADELLAALERKPS